MKLGSNYDDYDTMGVLMELDCNESKHVCPDCCYDWAYPINWIIDVQRVMGSDYRPLNGHMIWRYGLSDGKCGQPVGLCAAAQRIIDEYIRRKSSKFSKST